MGAFRRQVLLLLLSLVNSRQCLATEELLVLVNQGEVRVEGLASDGWGSRDGHWVGSGREASLWSPVELGAGDFEIRLEMTIWISRDEGETWPASRLVHAGGAAYSSLVDLAEERFGLLFERDGDQAISFVTFSLNGLEGE